MERMDIDGTARSNSCEYRGIWRISHCLAIRWRKGKTFQALAVNRREESHQTNRKRSFHRTNNQKIPKAVGRKKFLALKSEQSEPCGLISGHQKKAPLKLYENNLGRASDRKPEEKEPNPFAGRNLAG
jgi:hypothetical protein